MVLPFQTVTDLAAQAPILRRRRYGMIEMADRRLVGIHLRPWPKLISYPEIWWLGSRFHRQAVGDRCWLYYNQPLQCPNFLALPYVVSSRNANPATLHGALAVLDEIARIKGSDAILAEVSNARISDRLLNRRGWQSHYPASRRRHFIRRFYGQYESPLQLA